MGELTVLIGFIFGLILTIAWIAIPFILMSINKKAQRILNGMQLMEQHLRNINSSKNAGNKSE